MTNEENELVLQPNQVSRASYKMDATERKIIYYSSKYIQYKALKEGERKTYNIDCKVSEILKALQMKNTTSNRQNIRKAVETIANKNKIEIKNNTDKYEAISWFERIYFSDSEDRITIEFSHYIGELYIKCKKQFSLINLETIGQLKSYYAMRYYEIALSWLGMKGKNGNEPNKWYFELTIEEIKKMFQLNSDYYKNNIGQLTKDIIKKPITELNTKNKEFQISLERIKDFADERSTKGYKFVCEDISASQPIHKTKLKEASKEKCGAIKIAQKQAIESEQDTNSQADKIEAIKAKGLNIWETAYNLANMSAQISPIPMFESNKLEKAIEIANGIIENLNHPEKWTYLGTMNELIKKYNIETPNTK